MRYPAFISYSHRDASWANWLHRRIERFTIPKRLQNRQTPARQRLTPIFKDSEELGAAGNLSEVIRQALAQSRYLLVVCSPDAASSRWVNEEVAEFQRVHGNSNILCCVVDGIVPEVFPDAIARSGIEPLAVDVRRSGDGKRTGLLKIIAGLLEVPFSELQRRELHRRNRRLALTSTAAVAGMILTSSLAWYAAMSQRTAEVARKEAQRRQLQAEELIDFMLGDLRDKLQPIGRLDLLEEVGDHAETYFDSLAAQDLTDAARLSRAKAMHQLGEVRVEAGDMKGAQLAFTATLNEMLVLHRSRPTDPDRLFELGQAHYWAGFSGWYSKDFDRAAEHWREYMRLSKSLASMDPENLEWQREVAYAYGNLGTLETDRSRLDLARVYLTESAALFERLHEQSGDPQDSYELSANLSWLGSLYRNVGQLEDALVSFQREEETLISLLRESDNAHWRYSHITALRHKGDLYIDLGNVSAALLAYTDALARLQDLRNLDPRNSHWQFGEAIIQSDLAAAHLYAQEFQVADELLKRSAENVEVLLVLDPANPRWRQLGLEAQALRIKMAAARGHKKSVKSLAHRLINGANGSEHATSLPVAWAEVLLAESLPDGTERRVHAGIAQRLIGEATPHVQSPDAVVPLYRARVALAEPVDKLVTQLQPWLERGLLHPGLPEELRAAARR